MSKDTQNQLKEICAGMTARNVYSQLAYFLIDIACSPKNPYTESREISEILGLISDSYFGKVATGQISQQK